MYIPPSILLKNNSFCRIGKGLSYYLSNTYALSNKFLLTTVIILSSLGEELI